MAGALDDQHPALGRELADRCLRNEIGAGRLVEGRLDRGTERRIDDQLLVDAPAAVAAGNLGDAARRLLGERSVQPVQPATLGCEQRTGGRRPLGGPLAGGFGLIRSGPGRLSGRSCVPLGVDRRLESLPGLARGRRQPSRGWRIPLRAPPVPPRPAAPRPQAAAVRSPPPPHAPRRLDAARPPPRPVPVARPAAHPAPPSASASARSASATAASSVDVAGRDRPGQQPSLELEVALGRGALVRESRPVAGDRLDLATQPGRAHLERRQRRPCRVVRLAPAALGLGALCLLRGDRPRPRPRPPATPRSRRSASRAAAARRAAPSAARPAASCHRACAARIRASASSSPAVSRDACCSAWAASRRACGRSSARMSSTRARFASDSVSCSSASPAAPLVPSDARRRPRTAAGAPPAAARAPGRPCPGR